MSPLPTRMANRWERRRSLMLPPGQGRLYWHVLLGEDPQARAIVEEAHDRLAGLAGLDLVPRRFIHLTTFVAGYTHEITERQVTVMAEEAAGQLARVEPITVTLGRVLYHPEAVVLEARPAERLRPLLEAARFATRAATGRDGVLAHDTWLPHVTVAYSNADGPAAPIIDALGERLPEREVTIRSIHVVNQDGPETAWDWRPVAEVRLGAA
ncbi:2'-5' RNA ligase family protein [Nonomuraea angiospora]|uniref:2'-5' RNA ligase family protein n=1 Tax=Nonomuraea angiospora TaxID=46172 RepID=UPI0029BB2D5A|nr:2'-5' RNA ligase family protein [Nonomuraea angiospora]MDX3101017.1 2'-5' RNA ligase family protein [Nonomuraea angiospora]